MAAGKHGALRNQWMRHPYVAGYTPNLKDSLRSAVDVCFGFVAAIGSRDMVRIEENQHFCLCGCVDVRYGCNWAHLTAFLPCVEGAHRSRCCSRVCEQSARPRSRWSSYSSQYLVDIVSCRSSSTLARWCLNGAGAEDAVAGRSSVCKGDNTTHFGSRWKAMLCTSIEHFICLTVSFLLLQELFAHGLILVSAVAAVCALSSVYVLVRVMGILTAPSDEVRSEVTLAIVPAAVVMVGLYPFNIYLEELLTHTDHCREVRQVHEKNSYAPLGNDAVGAASRSSANRHSLSE